MNIFQCKVPVIGRYPSISIWPNIYLHGENLQLLLIHVFIFKQKKSDQIINCYMFQRGVILFTMKHIPIKNI